MATYEGGSSGGTGVSNNTTALGTAQGLTLPTHQTDDYAIVFSTAHDGTVNVNLTSNAEYTELQDGTLIDAQDETLYSNAGNEGTFAGGTGYTISDSLTMSDSSTVTVDNVAGGVVTEFTVDSSGASGGTEAGDVLTATGGTGADFTLTPQADNIYGFPYFGISGLDTNIQVFYRKLTSSSDTEITLTKASTCRASGVMHLWRGLDGTTPFDVSSRSAATVNEAYDAVCPPITPVTDNGALILVGQYGGPAAGLYVTAFGAPATPAGLSQGESFIPNDGSDFQDITTAYDADYGTAATITPTYWTNEVGGATVADAQTNTDYDGGTGEGSFTGGTGYAVSDTITITGGATVNVDSIDGGGSVLTFTVTTGIDTGGHARDDTLSQTGVAPTGPGAQTGFSLTLNFDNISGAGVEVGLGTLVLRPAVGGASVAPKAHHHYMNLG